MTYCRLLATSMIFAATFAAGCNTTKNAGDGQKAGKQGGVAIQSKIDDGRKDGASGPGSGSPAAAGTGSANTGGTATPTDTAKPADAAQAASDCYKSDPSICKIEAEILRLTNIERAAPSGLFKSKMQPLKLAPKMSWVARDWSAKQGSRGNIGHDGFPNQRERTFQGEFKGSRAEISAENVAMTGYGDDSDVARQFFDMWKHSPGHYENMMGDYAAMGIGVAKSGDGWYATEIFGDE